MHLETTRLVSFAQSLQGPSWPDDSVKAGVWNKNTGDRRQEQVQSFNSLSKKNTKTLIKKPKGARAGEKTGKAHTGWE